jgi:hypothetical protein
MTIHAQIDAAFNHLSQLNAMIYDYWINQLYDDDGDIVWQMWNPTTLKLMQTDVLIGRSQLSLD